MRNWIIGLAALVAVAAPGVAAAQNGYVGAVGGTINVDDYGSSDVNFYGIEGAVAFEGSGSIGFEIDASVIDSDDFDTSYALVGHLFTRNDRYLFGGFVGVGGSDGDTTWQAGLEANKYFDRVTLAGAITYASNDDANVDATGINVEARWFVHDNFRLSGNVGLANVDYTGGDSDLLLFGVGAEYQFSAVPISIGGSYTRIDFDDANVEADRFGVTLRYNWGGSLFDRDRRGASQAGISALSSALSF